MFRFRTFKVPKKSSAKESCENESKRSQRKKISLRIEIIRCLYTQLINLPTKVIVKKRQISCRRAPQQITIQLLEAIIQGSLDLCRSKQVLKTNIPSAIRELGQPLCSNQSDSRRLEQLTSHNLRIRRLQCALLASLVRVGRLSLQNRRRASLILELMEHESRSDRRIRRILWEQSRFQIVLTEVVKDQLRTSR